MMREKMISFFGNTDLGKNRTNNEDAFIAQFIWSDQVMLAAAIDGVGGYEGGEIAAAIAKQTIVDYLQSYPNGKRSDLIKQAVVEANNAIYKAREEYDKHPQMSCVLTAALIDTQSGYLHMAHIGDTRLYQYADGQIKKLSHDHSLVGYREEIGELTEDEAMHHPQRNVISRDVGSQFMDINTDQVETASFPLVSNATYLLCSDGLSDMLTSSMMEAILNSDKTPEEKVQALIDKANEEGGNDNITVVLANYTGPSTIVSQVQVVNEEEKTTQQEAENVTSVPPVVSVNLSRVEFLLTIISILLFVIICLLGYSLYLKNLQSDNPNLLKTGSADSIYSNPNRMDSCFIDSTSNMQISVP